MIFYCRLTTTFSSCQLYIISCNKASNFVKLHKICQTCLFSGKSMKSQKFPFQLVLTTFKDTDREEVPSNKSQALAKSRNRDIWVIGTSNQFFIRGS